MHEAADRLGSAASERELTVSQEVRFETCVYLGAALYSLGRSQEAVKTFETAFRLSPTPIPPSELTFNLVQAYLAAGRRGAAREALLFLLNYAPVMSPRECFFNGSMPRPMTSRSPAASWENPWKASKNT